MNARGYKGEVWTVFVVVDARGEGERLCFSCAEGGLDRTEGCHISCWEGGGGRGQILIEHASLTNKKCQSLGCTAVGCDVEFIWVGINQEIEWRTTKMVDG